MSYQLYNRSFVFFYILCKKGFLSIPIEEHYWSAKVERTKGEWLLVYFFSCFEYVYEKQESKSPTLYWQLMFWKCCKLYALFEVQFFCSNAIAQKLKPKLRSESSVQMLLKQNSVFIALRQMLVSLSSETFGWWNWLQNCPTQISRCTNIGIKASKCQNNRCLNVFGWCKVCSIN